VFYQHSEKRTKDIKMSLNPQFYEHLKTDIKIRKCKFKNSSEKSKKGSGYSEEG
jgi:hypothetical protein